MDPEHRPPHLLLAALQAATFHARWSLSLSLSFLSFSLYGAGALLQRLSSLLSAVVSKLLTCPPSLTSVMEGGGGGGGSLVARAVGYHRKHERKSVATS